MERHDWGAIQDEWAVINMPFTGQNRRWKLIERFAQIMGFRRRGFPPMTAWNGAFFLRFLFIDRIYTYSMLIYLEYNQLGYAKDPYICTGPTRRYNSMAILRKA